MGRSGAGLLSRIGERRIRALLSIAGREAEARREALYLVGGAVRDILLSRPLGDLDLVVEGDPGRLGRRIAAAAGGRSGGLTSFGTCRVEIPGGPVIDLAMSRREIYRAPAALPQVSPAPIEQDLRRRDFTVNSMALRLSGSGRGDLLDPTGGRRDLDRRLLRVHHALSLVDDPTRAFRGARHAGRLGLRPAPGWREAIRRAARAKAFDALSAARLRREIDLILREAQPVPALKLCEKWRLLQFVHPGLSWRRPVGRALRRWLSLRGPGQTAVTDLPLTLLTLSLGPTGRRGLLRRLGLGDSAIRRLSVAAEAPARIARLIGAAAKGNAPLSFTRVSALAAEEDLSLLVVRCAGEARTIRKMDAALSLWRRSRPSLSGFDLIRLGVPEGKRIGRILVDLRRARFEGRVAAAGAEEIEWVRSHS